MPSFKLKWEHPAAEVSVLCPLHHMETEINLDKVGNVFEKVVELPGLNKVHYKFIVDGSFAIDHKAPQEPDKSGTLWNILASSDVYPYQELDFDTHESASYTWNQPQPTILNYAAV
jgi:hypothetical protein